MLKDLTKKNQDVPQFKKWVNCVSDKLFNNKSEDKNNRLSHQQMTVLKSLQDNKYNIIKGFRCSGISTLLRLNTVYSMLYSSTEKKYHVIWFLDSKASIEYEKSKFLLLLDMCDEMIYLNKKTNNGFELLFEDKNIEIEFISAHSVINECRAKYDVVDIINIDHAAYIDDKKVSDEIANLAAMTKARVNIGSNPNGDRGFFYETWRDSLIGTAPFKTLSLKWYLDDRFNKNLKGSTGLMTYDIDNVGMLCEALENHDIITNEWYEQKKALLGNDLTYSHG